MPEVGSFFFDEVDQILMLFFRGQLDDLTDFLLMFVQIFDLLLHHQPHLPQFENLKYMFRLWSFHQEGKILSDFGKCKIFEVQHLNI